MATHHLILMISLAVSIGACTKSEPSIDVSSNNPAPPVERNLPEPRAKIEYRRAVDYSSLVRQANSGAFRAQDIPIETAKAKLSQISNIERSWLTNGPWVRNPKSLEIVKLEDYYLLEFGQPYRWVQGQKSGLGVSANYAALDEERIKLLPDRSADTVKIDNASDLSRCVYLFGRLEDTDLDFAGTKEICSINPQSQEDLVTALMALGVRANLK